MEDFCAYADGRDGGAAAGDAGGESDPRGLPAHSPGAKLDRGKIRVGMVLLGFSRALAEVARVGTYGAEKYTADGWVEVPDGEARYTDAMFRHLFAEAGGEESDRESGLAHAAHAAWNALARLDLAMRRKEEEANERTA